MSPGPAGLIPGPVRLLAEHGDPDMLADLDEVVAADLRCRQWRFALAAAVVLANVAVALALASQHPARMVVFGASTLAVGVCLHRTSTWQDKRDTAVFRVVCGAVIRTTRGHAAAMAACPDPAAHTPTGDADSGG